MSTSDTLLLTVDQARGRLTIGRTRMFELIASGAIESVTIGRSRRIPEAALDRYVEGLLAAKSGGAATPARRPA